MLKSKDVFKEGEVAGFRLVTGEEVLGKVKTVDEDTIVVDKPFTLGTNAEGNIQFVPISFIGDPEKPVVFERKSIIATITPREELVKGYLQTTSNIAFATDSDLQKVVGANPNK